MDTSMRPLPVADAQSPADSFVLWPHRSLGRSGAAALLATVATGLVVPILAIAGPGAWPLFLPAGATLAGLAVAIRANNRSARHGEIIHVGSRSVRVERHRDGGAAVVAEFSSYWVRVVLETDHYVEDRLTLREGRRACAVGTFLSPPERKELARAIERRLSALRECDMAANDGDPGY